MKKLFSLLIIYFIASQGFSQTEDALVFFADKQDVAFSIANPITILTQEAIDRKTSHNTPIDERDVPLNETYKAAISNTQDIEVLAKSKWLNAVYVRGDKSQIDTLLDLSFVIEIEFMNKGLNRPVARSIYNDKFVIESPEKVTYNYGTAQNQIEMIGVDHLHDNDYTGEGITLAFMDNGYPGAMENIAFSHVRNEGKLLGYYDFVSRTETLDGSGDHGAHTWSTAAAKLEGSDSFIGTAPKASYYLFITEDGAEESPAEEAYWVEALERADSLGVYVVNTSLGYHIFDNAAYNHSFEDLDGQTSISARGANVGFDKGMLLVTAAGNEGYGSGLVSSPADAPGTLTVVAVNASGTVASFSSSGPTSDGRIKPDVMAQGEGATIVDQYGIIAYSNGTSFSSPIIAGAVASLWQAVPNIKNEIVMQSIRESASLYNNPTDAMGYGIPNFQTALNNLLLLNIEAHLQETEFALYPNPVSTDLNINFPESINEAELSLYNFLGQKILQKRITATSNQIDVSNFPSGLYIASITSNGKTINYKIIKK